MRRLRQRGFLGPAALSLAAVFFVAQVFACCHANARFGRSLVSLFTHASQPASQAAHACCAKAAPDAGEPVAPPASSDCARQCCLQQAVQHAPQLASVPGEAPVFSASFALLPAFAEHPVALGERLPAVIDSGPPLYLRTLRLLV